MEFAEFSDIVVHHIPQQLFDEMSQKSHVVPIGIYLKNENKRDEMVSIMEKIQQYVPHVRKTISVQIPGSEEQVTVHQDYFTYTSFGGDQLTKARAIGAQRIKENSVDGLGRLQVLVPVIEDWHARVFLLGASFITVNPARR